MSVQMIELEEIKVMDASDEMLEISCSKYLGALYSITCPVQGVDGEQTPCTGI